MTTVWIRLHESPSGGLELEELAGFAIASVDEEWAIVFGRLDAQAAVTIGDGAVCSNGPGGANAASAANNIPNLWPGYKRQ